MIFFVRIMSARGGLRLVWEVHTQAALFTALLGPQTPKWPMGVSGCGPGHHKAGGYALFGLLGGLSRG